MQNTFGGRECKLRLDKSYIRSEPLKIKKVKRQKIKYHE